MRTKGLFIAGTDTGVGKSIVAAGLVSLARLERIAAIGVKPVETGCRVESGVLWPEDGGLLQAAGGHALTLEECAPFRFRLPASPYRAAQAEGTPIDLGWIEAHIKPLALRADLTIVEGAGGLMVPVTESALMIDLMQTLAYPVILVARTSLGTVNHTLLSVEALKGRGLTVAGIVLSRGSRRAGEEEEFTPSDISRFTGDIPLVVLPHMTKKQRSHPRTIAERMRRAWPREIWSKWLSLS
ncbi:MAG: dethiobiotin synthase [Thermodesulfobacteriota bacterium]